jgi:GT2 family glycosyltransferase
LRPPLSIVIPSHNRPELLQLCLQSVERHAPKGTEIVVVDDASAEGIVSATAQRFDGVRVLRLERPSGFCVAANTGLRATNAEVVELLNDDTEVSSGWADAALAHFADVSIGAVAPLVLCGSPTDAAPRVDSAGDRYFAGGVAGKRGHGRLLDQAFLLGGEVFGASASSAFYRRDLVLSLGGFPEHFGAYFEDVDLAFRLHWAGARILYEPQSRVWHRVSASYGAPAAELLERQSRNEELVFWRNLPASRLWRVLPLHAAVVAGKAWRRWREGQLLPFLRGRLQALGEAAEIVRHRRRLQRLHPSFNDQTWGIESRFWGAL